MSTSTPDPKAAAQAAADAANAAAQAAHTPSRLQKICADAKARLAQFAAEVLQSSEAQRFVADISLTGMGALVGFGEKAFPPLEAFAPLISGVETHLLTAEEAEMKKLGDDAKAAADKLAAAQGLGQSAIIDAIAGKASAAIGNADPDVVSQLTATLAKMGLKVVPA